MGKPKKSSPVGKASTQAADRDIAAVYDQLAGQLSDGAGVTGMNFDRARQLVGSAYDQQAYSMQRAASATQGGLNGQFSRLGIGAATDSATQGLRNQLAQGLISAARRRQNDLAGMGQQQVGYEMAGRMGIDNSRREGAQQRTNAITRIQEALAAMETVKAQAQGSVDLARVQGQTELEKLKLQFAQAQQGAAAGDPLDALRAESLGLDILLKQNRLNGTEDPTIQGDGQAALEQFIAQNASEVTPDLLAKFNALKDKAFVAAAQPTDTKYRSDPYAIAMGRLMAHPEYGGSELNQRLLEEMLQTYFG